MERLGHLGRVGRRPTDHHRARGDASRRVHHHRAILRVHRLRQRDHDLLSAHVRGGDARPVQGHPHRPPAPHRSPRHDSIQRLGIPERAHHPALACRHGLPAERDLRAPVHGEESAGRRARLRRHARLRLLPAPLRVRRLREPESARRTRRSRLLLRGLAAGAVRERLRHARVQRGRARTARHRRSAELDRGRQRQRRELPIRAAGAHRAEPAEPPLPRGELPLRVPQGPTRSPARPTAAACNARRPATPVRSSCRSSPPTSTG
jgi:hypothetical protein